MARFLEPCLLLLLIKAPAHGYELLGRLEEFGLDPEEQDPGLLYRTLRRMEEEGFLQSHWDTETGGPAKRLYKVTEDGEELLHAWTGVSGATWGRSRLSSISMRLILGKGLIRQGEGGRRGDDGEPLG